MKSLFEQMGGPYRLEGDYLIPNLALPEEPDYQIGKCGHMRRSYLKGYRPVLYTNFLTTGTLHRHLAEIDQACNERMEIVVSAMTNLNLRNQVVEVVLIKNLPIDEPALVQNKALLSKGVQHLGCPLAELRGSAGIDPIAYSNNGGQRIKLVLIGFPVIRNLCKICTSCG